MNACAIPQVQQFQCYKCFNDMHPYSHIVQLDVALVL